MKILLGTAYWPNLHYFYHVLRAEEVLIEQHDSYHKQSYRNRCRILSANGPLDLCIPVKKMNGAGTTQFTQIAYHDNWMIRHWRAITSAYNNSPYFEFFETEISVFYTQRFGLLQDYNQQQLITLLRLLKLKKPIAMTDTFVKLHENVGDLRDAIHPKVNFQEDSSAANLLSTPYYQTFGNKFGFQPNLSILDLLFNEGLGATDYLLGKRNG